ncbi:MAG: aldo/keto reductase [Actinomycetia bacterium]|nr:aldo/keto reductase [Actinomycetes bacterium]
MTLASPLSSHTTASGIPRPGGTGWLAGRPVSRIGYGTAPIGRMRIDHDDAVALVRRAVELGVDHVDTAQFYGDGFANDAIRDALRPEDGVVVVTKVGADADPSAKFPLRPAQKPHELRVSVDDNLRSLGVDQVPVVNLRRLDVGPGLSAEGDQVVDLDDQLAVLTQLRDEGKIGAIGLSGVTIAGLRRALPAGIACVQNAYSLVARDDEEMLQLCATEDIAWVPFWPLGGGLMPNLPTVTDEPTVQAVARNLGVTPAQVGLAWLLHHEPNLLLIAGTTDAGHLEANLAAGAIALDNGTLAELDGVPSRSVDVRL